MPAYPNFSHFCIKDEEDIPIPRREYDDLNLRYTQLQNDCEPAAGEKLQAENAKLREELKNSAFSYATIKCKMGQMLSFTGLTSFIFEYNRQNHRQCRNNLPKYHSAGSSHWFLLMKLRVGLK